MSEKEIVFHKTAGTFLLRYDLPTAQRLVYLIYYNRTPKLFGRSSAKGHIEEGETIEEASIRETKEETGYQDFKIIGYLGCNEYQYDVGDGYIHCKQTYRYCAQLISEERKDLALIGDEMISWTKDGWFPIDQIEELLRFDDEKSLVPKIKEIIKKINM